jgi:hypothetical protein
VKTDLKEILSYNKVMQHSEKDNDDGETFWKYKRISGHEGFLNKNHLLWKGDKYNIKVEWEIGEVSYEQPLHTIAVDDHVTCTIYSKEPWTTGYRWMETYWSHPVPFGMQFLR